ncbi:MAG: DUF4878 domain-containing protein [Thiomonas sp.]|uniref:DUF4878 domain-containing protein n=1 Tax=Thiomonas sp. TaxID=2047785 RepID=UPI002A3655ED|nr:DUF4878 domain-containing protein [Thiomonas sp.]MDY0329513.1 DUF4878 domain-containing protein [Thiomonas sp.]
MTVLLMAVAALAWMVFARSSGPTDAQLRRAANGWLQQHQADLLNADACVRDFNYAANPVFVNGFDQATRNWLDALVKVGIYAAPQQVQNGFMPQWKYAYGPQAATYIRDGALCAASGMSVEKVALLQPGSAAWSQQFASGVKLPEDWAAAQVRLQWTGLAPWVGQQPVSEQFPNLSAALHQTLLLHKTAQGWVLPAPADELAMRAQLGAQTVGGEITQAAQQFANGLAAAASPGAGSPNAQAATQTSSGSGWLDWLKNLFGLGDPAQRVPEWFYRDVAQGHFDRAYGLLGPQFQIFGPDKMKAYLAHEQKKIESEGGLRSITAGSATDAGDQKQVRYTLHFGNGSQRTETMTLGKVDGKWRILEVKG